MNTKRILISFFLLIKYTELVAIREYDFTNHLQDLSTLTYDGNTNIYIYISYRFIIMGYMKNELSNWNVGNVFPVLTSKGLYLTHVTMHTNLTDIVTIGDCFTIFMVLYTANELYKSAIFPLSFHFVSSTSHNIIIYW